jgi:hypothetical protein
MVALAALAGLLTAACASGHAAGSAGSTAHLGPQPQAQASPVGRDVGPFVRIRTGNRAATALLRRIIDGLGSHSTIVSAVVAPSPRDIGRVHGPWLYLRAREPGTEAGDRLVEWEAQLVVGAYRDTSARLGLPGARGVTLTALLPNGHSRYDSNGSTGWIGARQRAYPRAIDEAWMAAQIRRTIIGDGMRPVAIGFVAPDDAAPIVIASTTDPAQALADRIQFREAAFGNPNNLEGYFIEIVDRTTGRIVSIDDDVGRLSSGSETPVTGLVFS